MQKWYVLSGLVLHSLQSSPGWFLLVSKSPGIAKQWLFPEMASADMQSWDPICGELGAALGMCRFQSPLLCLGEMLSQVVHNLFVHVASLSELFLVEAGLGPGRQLGKGRHGKQPWPSSLWCPGHTPGDSLAVPPVQQHKHRAGRGCVWWEQHLAIEGGICATVPTRIPLFLWRNSRFPAKPYSLGEWHAVLRLLGASRCLN